MLHQVGVDFDGNHAGGAAQQLFRQRAAAGTDFDHQVFACGTDGNGNPLQDGAVGQKVLPELLRQGGRLAPQAVGASEDTTCFRPQVGWPLTVAGANRESRIRLFISSVSFAAGKVEILYPAALVDQQGQRTLRCRQSGRCPIRSTRVIAVASTILPSGSPNWTSVPSATFQGRFVARGYAGSSVKEPTG